MQGEIHHVLNPNPYRGVFGSDASLYAQDVQDHIDHGTSGNVAGFIAETIQVRQWICSVSRQISTCIHKDWWVLVCKSDSILSFWRFVGSWRSSWTCSGILEIGLWHCTEGWWSLHCRWGANWIWSNRKSLLGFPDPRCNSRYSYDGKGIDLFTLQIFRKYKPVSCNLNSTFEWVLSMFYTSKLLH